MGKCITLLAGLIKQKCLAYGHHTEVDMLTSIMARERVPRYIHEWKTRICEFGVQRDGVFEITQKQLEEVMGLWSAPTICPREEGFHRFYYAGDKTVVEHHGDEGVIRTVEINGEDYTVHYHKKNTIVSYRGDVITISSDSTSKGGISGMYSPMIGLHVATKNCYGDTVSIHVLPDGAIYITQGKTKIFIPAE